MAKRSASVKSSRGSSFNWVLGDVRDKRGSGGGFFGLGKAADKELVVLGFAADKDLAGFGGLTDAAR
jgi:hypothetical protein